MPTRGGGLWVFQDQYDYVTTYLCDPEFYLHLGIAVCAYMAWVPDIRRCHVRANQAITQKVKKLKLCSLIVLSVLALMVLHGRSFPDKVAGKAVMNCQVVHTDEGSEMATGQVWLGMVGPGNVYAFKRLEVERCDLER
ncbi:uncharacterized protein FPRN_12011 [Fusarium proliferatum]|nr:uncharacterized protein FPRN_12011 [Fusarium proliferatum]